jgi:hypothetical protein
MYWENYVIMTNTGMSTQSGLGETLKSYAFYNELTSADWRSAMTYSTIDGFDNNMEAMIHYGKITLERLEHYEEYEKCKRLNYMIKLYEPLVRKS